MDDKKLSYEQALAELKDQAATMLEQCDPLKTPTICQLLTIPGNKDLLIESIVDYAKKGIRSDRAISMLEREYNPNTLDD